MTNGLGVALLLSLLASDPGGLPVKSSSICALLGGIPLFQIDELDLPPEETEGEGWGIRRALPQNVRFSMNFASAYILTTSVTDADHPYKWNELWKPGLGGGLGLAYQIMPIFRFGGGVGYFGFHGTKVRSRPVTTDYMDMHLLPVHVCGTLSLPLDLPLVSWVTPGKGYVNGPVPYIQVDVGWTWRRKVEAEVETSGTGSTDLEIFKECFRSFLGFRVGLEFRSDRVGFFIDFGYRLFERPKKDDDLIGNALEMHTLPVQCGFACYFGG